MPSVYVVWDRKEKKLASVGVLPDATAASNAINKMKQRDRAAAEAGKTYDAVQVTV